MITEKDWQGEQQRVHRVVGEITKQINNIREDVSEKTGDIVEFRKAFWEDVTVNFEDTYEAAETYASIKQQAELLSERERTHRHAEKQLKTLLRLKQSPYFGRIDFIEDGEKKADQIYLGIASLLDDNDLNFLIYDWRAPVSSLYYDYPPGPADYGTPVGTISGTIELKRQFMIRDGQIKSMFDTGVTIGDELLQEVLGKHSDSQMKSIVATIQKEQNQIIRNERSRLLVVQGAAGSGKTSAALQRVAYLLYRYRNTLRADQIVLFSPNTMFNSYVSTVLPELGEENMQQTTFQEYLEHRLGKVYRIENPFTQMEYALTAVNEEGYKARIEAMKFKASQDFMHVVEQYITHLGTEGLIFNDVKFRDDVLISAELIKEQFYTHEHSLPIPNRMKLISDWLRKELRKQELVERSKDWVKEEIELLDDETYLWAYNKLQKNNRFTENSFDDFESEEDLLAKRVVERKFKSVYSIVQRLQFVDITSIYRQLFVDWQYVSGFATGMVLPESWESICTETLLALDQNELKYEDATPFLYLKERIEGFQTNNIIRHVFIDEAQDYSPFQFAFIKRLFPHGKMTALGDWNQAIYSHTSSNNGFKPLLSLYETEQTEKIVLTRSYRSTRQIVEFTKGIIVGGEEIEPFNREGKKPTITEVMDKTKLIKKVTSRIMELQAAGHQTIGVICKTTQESQEAYHSLKENLPLRLISKESISFEPGSLVIPSYLAKGVEFDAVIIFNGSEEQYGRESERKLFYTACTRAMHELHIYSVGKMSPFISTVDPETYTRNEKLV